MFFEYDDRPRIPIIQKKFQSHTTSVSERRAGELYRNFLISLNEPRPNGHSAMSIMSAWINGRRENAHADGEHINKGLFIWCSGLLRDVGLLSIYAKAGYPLPNEPILKQKLVDFEKHMCRLRNEWGHIMLPGTLAALDSLNEKLACIPQIQEQCNERCR